jgi:methylated-DNA-protein-cysteine methyltransferase-like protein
MPRVHGEVSGDKSQVFRRVYALVSRIPKGRVMTYGQIATLIENRVSPRAVGWAMRHCPSGVPWQRVVNASGGTSTDRLPDMPPGLQRAILEAEGVAFRQNGTLDLERYRWVPPLSTAPRPRRSSRRT